MCKIKETSDIESAPHSRDAGDTHSMQCPNCESKVLFSDYQWWRSECECGEWELVKKAVLTPANPD